MRNIVEKRKTFTSLQSGSAKMNVIIVNVLKTKIQGSFLLPVTVQMPAVAGGQERVVRETGSLGTRRACVCTGHWTRWRDKRNLASWREES